jgi:hypothetical protein
VTGLRSVFASRWFKILLSAGLLALLFIETDVGQMRAALMAAKFGWLAVALLTFVLSQVVSAYRWALLAHAVVFESLRTGHRRRRRRAGTLPGGW